MTKDNNTDDLNLGSSWVGGSAPDSSGTARWDNTVTNANTTFLGADLTWGSISIIDPGGLVTINAGHTLTNNGGIDMSAATNDLTLNCGYALGNSAIWNVAANQTLTMGGIVSGGFNITKQGSGKVILSGANTYSGSTAISGGTLQLGASDVIPDGSGKGDLSVAATCTLDLNGYSETINGLNGVSGSFVDNTAAATTSTLTVGSNNVTSTFSGVIKNTGSSSTNNLIKTGSGQLVLGGANTLSGTVTINQGNLTLGNANTFGNISGLTINGGAQLGLNANNAVISAPITLNGNATVIAQFESMKLTSLNGAIGGTGNLTFTTVNNTLNGSDSKVAIGAAGNFVGNVTITTGRDLNNMTVRLGAANALPTTALVTLDGLDGNVDETPQWSDLDLFGNDQMLAGLRNIARTDRLQRVYNSSGTPATLTVNNSANYAFGGTVGNTVGSGDNLTLVKSGAGALTLSGENTYANGTVINGGTLLVNNTTGSGTGSGAVTVNSDGTLGGTGTIAGAVTNNAGGTLTPGTSIGTLTVNGDLTLEAGSTNTFEVDGSTPANDSIVLGANVTYGGVLQIVPTGSFTTGQTFALFSGAGAASASNFDHIAVSSGGSLSFAFTNGVLTVVSAGAPPQPTIAPVTVSDTNLVVSVPTTLGFSYVLQSATNLTPAIYWQNESTNAGTGNNLTLNVPIEPSKPQKFLRFWVY